MTDIATERRRAIRSAIVAQAISQGATASVDLHDAVHILEWTNININGLTLAIDDALPQRGDSGAEARAEPSEASQWTIDGTTYSRPDMSDPSVVETVYREIGWQDLRRRVEELERWRSTFKSEMVERPSPPPPPPLVTCATCRGFGTYGTGVCPACKGAGVHRV